MRQQEPQTGNIMTSSTQKTPLNTQDEMKQQQKTDGAEHASKWAVLAIVAIGVFMATLDTSIVNISLPTIASSFGVPLSGAIEWVIIAYLVVIAGGLLTACRPAGLIGCQPNWATGPATFPV